MRASLDMDTMQGDRALHEATSPARSWTTGSKPKRKFAEPKKKPSTNADFCAGLASKSNALRFCSEAYNDSEVSGSKADILLRTQQPYV